MKSQPNAPLSRAQLEDRVDHRVHRDRILLNNPVIMQGIGLAPLIVSTTSGLNAFVLSIAILLLLTPTRVLASIFCHLCPVRFRGAVYILCSATVYIGVYWVLVRIFQISTLTQLGLYLPLLIADPIILKRYERIQNEKVHTAFRKGIITSAGYVLTLLIVGCFRELLSSGSIFGFSLWNFSLFPLAALPSGGFVVLAVVIVVWRSIVRIIKNTLVDMEEDACLMD